MAFKKQSKVLPSDINGLKFFDKLAPLFARLHQDGCERDKAGNRELHYDQYCMLMMLYLFNPILTSMRGIQQASQLEKVQKLLGCPKTSLGSLSEAAHVFDAERLQESSSPGEFHPQALTEPDVNVSAHPALIVQPPV